jgi:hypothetical protein
MSGRRVVTDQKFIVVRICMDNCPEDWAETAPLCTNYLPSFFKGEITPLELLFRV